MEKEKQVLLKQIMRFFGKKRVYLSEATAKRELKRRARRNEGRYSMPQKHKKFFERSVFDNQPFGIFYLHFLLYWQQPLPERM